MNYPPNNSSKFSYNTNRSMISETMFSNFTNVSEEKHKSIKINNFENIPKQMGKLNAPKIKNNNNLYENIPKKNYNGMYPYIKYESDILKKSYIPQKLDFSKNINITHPLSKSINISNKSASTIINNSDYGEFTSLTENSYNKNTEYVKIMNLIMFSNRIFLKIVILQLQIKHVIINIKIIIKIIFVQKILILIILIIYLVVQLI